MCLLITLVSISIKKKYYLWITRLDYELIKEKISLSKILSVRSDLVSSKKTKKNRISCMLLHLKWK